jgi:hypothetical protein
MDDTQLITPELSHKCDKCSKRYTNRQNLRKHKMVKHLGYKIRCEWCHKTYTSNSSLKRHVHSSKNAACKILEDTFHKNLEILETMKSGDKEGQAHENFMDPPSSPDPRVSTPDPIQTGGLDILQESMALNGIQETDTSIIVNSWITIADIGKITQPLSNSI